MQELSTNGIAVLNKIIEWVTSEKCIGTVIAVILMMVAIKLINRFLKKIDSNKYNDFRGNTIVVIHDALKILVYVIGITTILQINGINTTSLVAGLGVVSTVVAFSLQDAMKDMIMGIHIIYDNFFKIGDVVEIGDYQGVVQEFNIRSTTLRSIVDGSTINLCNRDISRVIHVSNWLDIDLPLSYDEDVDKINRVLAATAEKIKKINGIEDCQYLGTQAFMDSAIAYKIRIYAAPDKKLILRRAAIQLIQREINENGIGIPYNQLDIHQI